MRERSVRGTSSETVIVIEGWSQIIRNTDEIMCERLEIDSRELDKTTEHVLVGLPTVRPLRKSLLKSSGVEPRKTR